MYCLINLAPPKTSLLSGGTPPNILQKRPPLAVLKKHPPPQENHVPMYGLKHSIIHKKLMTINMGKMILYSKDLLKIFYIHLYCLFLDWTNEKMMLFSFGTISATC